MKTILEEYGDLQGSFHKVRVNFVKKGSTKQEFMFFGGRLKDLKFNLNRWKWVKEVQLLDYTTKQGQE